jgi:hypothetical protein
MRPRRLRRFSPLRWALVAALGGAGVAAAQEGSYPTLRLSAFADATASYSIHSHATDFDFGEIDPYAEVRFSETWSGLAEALFQRVERGSSSDRPGRSAVEVDLERLYAAYSRSDALRLQIGEINSGIIGWNEREQVPRFLQTPIDVPSIARRQEQGGAWPLHLIGAFASGTAPGAAGLRYGVGIGEGRGARRDDTSLTARPTSAAGLISVAAAPEAVAGWTIGAAAFADRIPAAEGTYGEFDQTLSTSYLRGPLEVRGEWSRMEHRLGGKAYVSRGWYALVSWRLPERLATLRPYFLIDRLDVARDEPYLAGIEDQRAWAAGLRWDATKHLVLKADYQSQTAGEPGEERRIRVQLAVGF